MVEIPQVYHEFNKVFSKAKASGLPPHGPYNYAKELTAGTLDPLASAENKDMEEYIEEAL